MTTYAISHMPAKSWTRPPSSQTARRQRPRPIPPLAHYSQESATQTTYCGIMIPFAPVLMKESISSVTAVQHSPSGPAEPNVRCWEGGGARERCGEGVCIDSFPPASDWLIVAESQLTRSMERPRDSRPPTGGEVWERSALGLMQGGSSARAWGLGSPLVDSGGKVRMERARGCRGGEIGVWGGWSSGGCKVGTRAS